MAILEFLGGIAAPVFNAFDDLIYTAEEQANIDLQKKGIDLGNRQIDLGFDTNKTNIKLGQYSIVGQRQQSMTVLIGIGAVVLGGITMIAIWKG